MDPDELEQQNLDGADDGSQRSESEELAVAPSDVDALDYEDDDLEDPDETDLEDDTRAEELEPEPAPASRTTPKAAPSPRPAPTVTAPALTDQLRAEIDDMALTEGVTAAFDRYFEIRMAQERQSSRVSNHYARSFAADNPEFYEAYGADVEEVVEEVTRQRPNDPKAVEDAVNLGVLNVLLKQTRNGTDVKAAIAEAHRLLNAPKGNARPGPAPKAPLPREQRVPVPSGGGGARPASRPSATSRPRSGDSGSRLMRELAQEYGLDPATVRNLEYDVR